MDGKYNRGYVLMCLGLLEEMNKREEIMGHLLKIPGQNIKSKDLAAITITHPLLKGVKLKIE